MSPTVDFMTRLRKIDAAHLKIRDTMVLWVIAREHGTMGLEVAKKLGYPSRSHIQDGIRRLIDCGFVEDRRPQRNQQTPNELYATEAGNLFLADVVPQ